MTSVDCACAASLSIEPIHDGAALESMAAPWKRIAGDVPFRSWDWARTWWRHYRDAHQRLLLGVVRNDQQIVGIAPWYVAHSSRLGRTIRFLGSGEVCSDYLTMLSEPGLEEEVGLRVADWLASEMAGQWDLLDLSGSEQADASIAALTRRLADRGHRVDVGADVSCWRASLPTDWDTYLATLSKSRRERTRAMLRRAIDTGRAVVHRVTNDQQLEHAFAILVELHQKRRRSLSQTGCFASRRFLAFHREMARTLLADGRLRMLWTELEGRPISAEYGFVGGNTVYYYQGGFEPELSDERPGWLAFAVSLRTAIEEGFTAYDFLRGDESYKASWRATPRPLVRVRVVGRQRSARVRYSTWRACSDVKDWARGVLTRVRKS